MKIVSSYAKALVPPTVLMFILVIVAINFGLVIFNPLVIVAPSVILLIYVPIYDLLYVSINSSEEGRYKDYMYKLFNILTNMVILLKRTSYSICVAYSLLIVVNLL